MNNLPNVRYVLSNTAFSLEISEGVAGPTNLHNSVDDSFETSHLD